MGQKLPTVRKEAAIKKACHNRDKPFYNLFIIRSKHSLATHVIYMMMVMQAYVEYVLHCFSGYK